MNGFAAFKGTEINSVIKRKQGEGGGAKDQMLLGVRTLHKGIELEKGENRDLRLMCVHKICFGSGFDFCIVFVQSGIPGENWNLQTHRFQLAVCLLHDNTAGIKTFFSPFPLSNLDVTLRWVHTTCPYSVERKLAGSLHPGTVRACCKIWSSY